MFWGKPKFKIWLKIRAFLVINIMCIRHRAFNRTILKKSNKSQVDNIDLEPLLDIKYHYSM